MSKTLEHTYNLHALLAKAGSILFLFVEHDTGALYHRYVFVSTGSPYRIVSSEASPGTAFSSRYSEKVALLKSFSASSADLCLTITSSSTVSETVPIFNHFDIP